MAFVYLAVANFAPLVLVAQSAGTGNFSDIASQLLTSDQLPTADQRVTYKATDKCVLVLVAAHRRSWQR